MLMRRPRPLGTVGTGTEITGRLQSALYFIGSRWRDHPELTLQADTDPGNADLWGHQVASSFETRASLAPFAAASLSLGLLRFARASG